MPTLAIKHRLDAKADDCMDAGGRATLDAKADDCMDAGGRATLDAKAENRTGLVFQFTWSKCGARDDNYV